MSAIESLLVFDRLSLVMVSLVGFVGLCISFYAARYLKGDRKQRVFYINLCFLITSVFILVIADNIWLFLTAWTISSYVLTRLMVHKKEWPAAVESSKLALKNFLLGITFLAAAFLVLSVDTGETSIQKILSSELKYSSLITGGLLIILTSMTQSAIWPFHRWLTSSLNSPTPVSAMMHAGLINGGGFLLARFAPLYFQESVLLNSIFVIGIITALTGTLWKLMQSDVKRMLANSTMGQMGFMFAQCGLGLFPAAVAHLCWHGLFKAYLFLSSGSAAKVKRLDLDYPPSLKNFSLAFVCGLAGAYIFCLSSGKNFVAADTTVFLVALALIAGTQMALPLLSNSSVKFLPLIAALTMLMGLVYGLSIKLVTYTLLPMNISKPLELNALHTVALSFLTVAWLAIVFRRTIENPKNYPEWILKFYVRMLNASQPHPKTVTANRNKYKV
ncbi:MAG: hypothetical protein NE334_09040 [Lentisphaeraceae bacterium]|nr:hypothetical protein [Lentisphaeraceae bacterium]